VASSSARPFKMAKVVIDGSAAAQLHRNMPLADKDTAKRQTILCEDQATIFDLFRDRSAALLLSEMHSLNEKVAVGSLCHQDQPGPPYGEATP
jgi:hypothetical protein